MSQKNFVVTVRISDQDFAKIVSYLQANDIQSVGKSSALSFALELFAASIKSPEHQFRTVFDARKFLAKQGFESTKNKKASLLEQQEENLAEFEQQKESPASLLGFRPQNAEPENAELEDFDLKTASEVLKNILKHQQP
jgi:hypothetical protein